MKLSVLGCGRWGTFLASYHCAKNEVLLWGRPGSRGLAQRVGQCVGRNPLSILIPCHRVVGADGSLTGYAGGLARKRALLELEEPAERAAERLF